MSELTEQMIEDVGEVYNKVLPMSIIEPHPQNYNTHPDFQLRQLEASDARFNQVKSIVVQEGAPGRYIIVAGHGYYQARQQRGRQYIKADIIPANWSPDQVIGYLLADNLTSRAAVPDEDLLAQLLKDQADQGYDLMSLGTDEDELSDMLAKFAPPSLDELADEFGDDPEDETFWPVLKLKVSPETKDAFESRMLDMPGSNDDTKLAHMLSLINDLGEFE